MDIRYEVSVYANFLKIEHIFGVQRLITMVLLLVVRSVVVVNLGFRGLMQNMVKSYVHNVKRKNLILVNIFILVGQHNYLHGVRIVRTSKIWNG